MADWTLLESREISGRGILKVPTVAQRAYSLICTVTRLPLNSFYNNDFNPPRQFFGNICFLRDGNVLDSKLIQWQNQVWDFYPPYDLELFQALKCAHEGTLQAIISLGITIPGAGTFTPSNAIKDYEHLVNMWDVLQVVCWSSTALKLDLYSIALDTCNPDFSKPKKPPSPPTPPPPPDPPTKPGTTPPIPGKRPVSPPYNPTGDPDSQTGDAGGTAPYPADITPPSPPDPGTGNNCQNYIVAIRYTVGGTPVTRNYSVFGPIGTTKISDNQRQLILQCRGSGTTCDPFGDVVLESFGAPVLDSGSATIISIT